MFIRINTKPVYWVNSDNIVCIKKKYKGAVIHLVSGEKIEIYNDEEYHKIIKKLEME